MRTWMMKTNVIFLQPTQYVYINIINMFTVVIYFFQNMHIYMYIGETVIKSKTGSGFSWLNFWG